jgi:hypothetical protein
MTLIKHVLGKSHYVESMLQVIGLTFQTMHHIRDSLRFYVFIGIEPEILFYVSIGGHQVL